MPKGVSFRIATAHTGSRLRAGGSLPIMPKSLRVDISATGTSRGRRASTLTQVMSQSGDNRLGATRTNGGGGTGGRRRIVT